MRRSTERAAELRCAVLYVFLEVILTAFFVFLMLSPSEHDASYFLGMATVLFAAVAAGMGIASSLSAFFRAEENHA